MILDGSHWTGGREDRFRMAGQVPRPCRLAIAGDTGRSHGHSVAASGGLIYDP